MKMNQCCPLEWASPRFIIESDVESCSFKYTAREMLLPLLGWGGGGALGLHRQIQVAFH